MKADRDVKTYAVGALSCEGAAVGFAAVANLTRHFDGTLTDASTIFAGAGLVLVGAAVEGLRRLNRE